MSKDTDDDVVDSIIIETISTLPREMLEHYKNIPGRRPSENLKRVSKAIMSLDEGAAYEVIRDIVDSTVFAMLYTIDSNFKEKAIETSFTRLPEARWRDEVPLTERYRMKVDPGGLVCDEGAGSNSL